MSAPDIPPPPPLTRCIKDESEPETEEIRIGIEVEGVGTVATKWDRRGVVAQPNFHAVFKRTALVRSKSFSSTRGVYITPEDSDSFGTNSPAELVSTPHVLDGINLLYLRNSVWKALRRAAAPKTGTAVFSDPRAPNPAGPVAQSRWGRATVVKVGGSLQTTLGVAASKLFSDTASVRRSVIDLLVGKAMKADKVADMCKGAVVAEQYLTGMGQAFEGSGAGEYKYCVRLLLFMSFMQPMVEATEAGGENGVWAKDFLGANFKAQTSFVACGLRTALPRFQLAVLTPLRRAALKTGLLAALETGGVAVWLRTALNAHLDVSKIGQPGKSVQTAMEGWFAIPNFLNDGHLYTVVECREKDAALNKSMTKFLNTAPPTKPPQPVEPQTREWTDMLAVATRFAGELRDILAA